MCTLLSRTSPGQLLAGPSQVTSGLIAIESMLVLTLSSGATALKEFASSCAFDNPFKIIILTFC